MSMKEDYEVYEDAAATKLLLSPAYLAPYRTECCAMLDALVSDQTLHSPFKLTTTALEGIVSSPTDNLLDRLKLLIISRRKDEHIAPRCATLAGKSVPDSPTF